MRLREQSILRILLNNQKDIKMGMKKLHIPLTHEFSEVSRIHGLEVFVITEKNLHLKRSRMFLNCIHRKNQSIRTSTWNRGMMKHHRTFIFGKFTKNNILESKSQEEEKYFVNFITWRRASHWQKKVWNARIYSKRREVRKVSKQKGILSQIFRFVSPRTSS